MSLYCTVRLLWKLVSLTCGEEASPLGEGPVDESVPDGTSLSSKV